MTTYTITWGHPRDFTQRTERITGSDLATALRERFQRKTRWPWGRPASVSTRPMYNAAHCGVFQIEGRRPITGTWWETNLGDPE